MQSHPATPGTQPDCLLGPCEHTPLVGHRGHPDDHAHGHDHDHGHTPPAPGHAHGHGHDFHRHDRSILQWSFAITLVMMVVEIVTGLMTESLALVSDGIHMFTHAFALGLSWGAIVLATRAASPEKSFGYYRMEIVAAFACRVPDLNATSEQHDAICVTAPSPVAAITACVFQGFPSPSALL